MSFVLDPLRMPLAGVHSINASAGTGKTYTITTLYLRYLLQARCSVDQILVTTFTEAATAELKDRLRNRLSETLELLRECSSLDQAFERAEHGRADRQVVAVLEQEQAFEPESRDRVLERIDDAILSFDQAPVFTIHGFCGQVLQQLVFETGSRFNVELLKSQDPLIDEAVSDFVSRWWTASDSAVAEWLPLTETIWSQLRLVAKEAVDKPTDRVVPEHAGLDEVLQGDELVQFQRLAQQFSQLWVTSRDEIAALFDVAQLRGVLSQVNYKPAQVDAAFRFVDDLVRSPSPWAFERDQKGKLEPTAARFTQRRLEEGTKKATQGQEPRHHAFELLEELAERAAPIQAKTEQVRVLLLSRMAEFARWHVARHKDQHGLMSFSDMLHLVDDALARPERQSLRASLRDRYRVAMVDEFQDTDPVQFRIFRRIFLDPDERAATRSAVPRSQALLENDSGSDATSEPFPSGVWERADGEDSDDFDPFGDASSFYDNDGNDDDAANAALMSSLAESGEFEEPDASAERSAATAEPTADKFRAFVMIGDPKQSIYRFRGADLNAYLSAIAAVPENHRHQMDRNWRSDDSLVRAVQSFFLSQSNPFLSDAIPLPPVTAHYSDRFLSGPAFELRVVPRPDSAFQDKPCNGRLAHRLVLEEVAADIVRKLNAKLSMPSGSSTRPIKPGDMAVLCRAGWQLRRVQAVLAERGVPAVLHVEESVFATDEAQQVGLLLQAILHATGGRYLMNALRTPFCGFVASELARLPDDDDALAEWSERLRDWNTFWHRDGFIVMWRRLMEELNVVPRLAELMGGERQITNFLHLAELLHQHAMTQHAGPDELLRWFDHMRNLADKTDEVSQLRLETDADAVQLITIHKAKGLEFPVVYCPTLWNEFDEDRRTPPAIASRFGAARVELPAPELDVGSDILDQRRIWNAAEAEAEQRRLLYVALTRAKHQCVVHWIAVKDAVTTSTAQFLCPTISEDASDEQLSECLADWAQSTGVPRVRVVSADEISKLPDPGRSQWSAEQPEALHRREPQRLEILSKQQTSYSALVRMLPPHAIHDWTDRDELAPTSDLAVALPVVAGQLTPLAEMPGGTRVGDVVHRVLEKLLGQRPANETLLESVQRELQREMHRAALGERWLEPLSRTLAACLSEAIPNVEPAGRLIDVPSRDITCELPFVLRLGSDGDSAFDISALAECFERADQPFVREYAARVRGLSRGRLRGLLVGFIDVVFCWHGRWYVIDYKTTNLGPRSSDYSDDRLTLAMAQHDYFLQYHLYAVAVTQFLKQRIPDFDEARDFGGVLYFFLRGVDPRSPQLGGVFFDRPEPALIQSLTAALNGEVLA